MLGPNIFRFKVPLTERIESRISSAVSRRMLKRQNRLFSGSFSLPAAEFIDAYFDRDLPVLLAEVANSVFVQEPGVAHQN